MDHDDIAVQDQCIFLSPLPGAFASNHSCERRADWVVTDSKGRELPSCLNHAENYRVVAGYRVRRVGESQIEADRRTANERLTCIQAMRGLGIAEAQIMAHVDTYYPELAVS